MLRSCGAPNAREGLKGVFAPVGSYVPGIDLTLTENDASTALEGCQRYTPPKPQN